MKGIFKCVCRYFSRSSIDVTPEVKNALNNQKPVIALESALITHGFPYPKNVETALEMEDIIKSHNIIPATIGIINGRVKAGMCPEQINVLGLSAEKKTVQVSRRDFPYVLSQGLNGGTTVSGTLVIANALGIKIFVTGGIGGVHIDGQNSLDVNADLIELSRCAIMVVSAGIKSILDIGRTLEYPETVGVCVASYDSNGEFPAFYTKKSRYQSVYNVTSPSEAAGLLEQCQNTGSGVLLAVPILEERIKKTEIDKAIKNARQMCEKQGIMGKNITPFVLSDVSRLTEGLSMDTKISLLKNNSLVGSKIAMEYYSKLSSTPKSVFEEKKSMKKSTKSPIIGNTVMEEKGNPKSIKLPDTLEVFRNLKNAKQFAIDIGGSLTKIAYYSTVSFRRVYYATDNIDKNDDKNKDDKHDKFVYTYSEQARLHFVKFETKYIENCLDFIGDNLVNSDERKGKSIKATGGGAYKYSKLIQDKLGLKVDKEDELTCLITGCNFLLKNISDEAFVYNRNGSPEYEFQTADPHVFPYMLVNIGSGVSILKVESDNCYERIGGTATGGGTFWGLGTLLTKAKSFDELLDLAEKGDHRKADMLVKDIYGGDYETLGMHSDLIASSFGKICPRQNAESDYNEADLARSLLFAISNDIGQIACLYAMMHNLKKVYFGGYFLRNRSLSMHTISFSIKYWSRGTVQSLFLRHEGYLGAIGAFLKGTEECDGDKFSWLENYAGSGSNRTQLSFGKRVDQLELDRWESPLTFCPLLKDPSSYIPDTVDLNSDKEAREYWLNCFEESIENYVNYAIASQPTSDTAEERAAKFKEKFISRVQLLKIKPFAYGHLTVRGLLDTINQCLKEFDFPDPYLTQKRTENEYALTCFQERLEELDSLDLEERQKELIMGVLAGNTFDWGAKETVALMKTGEFDFKQARNRIPARPWLIDSLDSWVEKICNEPYKKIAIFIDNSGIDIVLGILPLAREMLRQGSRVILCANSAPALNDVTHTELVVLLRQIAAICPIISKGLDEGRLKSMETAQGGPCLDLSRLERELANELITVDLIILEGMGRAVHTNIDAEFVCDCFKLAIIKNRWLAKRLGGDMFSVVCKYESVNVSK